MFKIWGKLVGGILGFTFGGGPLGAVLGVAAGHAYDVRHSLAGGARWDELEGQGGGKFSSAAQQAAFTKGVIVLGAKLAKVNGRVTRAKIDAFKRAFHIKPEDEAGVGRMFDQARKSSEGFEPYAFSLAQTFCTHPAVLEDIISGLFLIAAASDNGVSPAEAAYLKSVAFAFNFGPEDFRRIAARTGVKLPSDEHMRDAQRETRRDNSSEPYAILGVSEQASNDDVKTAYRTLIRKHHPDKLVADGLPPDSIAKANEKMKRINVAYDSICKSRGIK